jgi:hypothetical protein
MTSTIAETTKKTRLTYCRHWSSFFSVVMNQLANRTTRPRSRKLHSTFRRTASLMLKRAMATSRRGLKRKTSNRNSRDSVSSARPAKTLIRWSVDVRVE